MSQLSEEIIAPEMEYQFDDDTQFIDDKPLIVFGETYMGRLTIRNPTKYQYLILDLKPEDHDMELEKYKEKYIFPGKTLSLRFKIVTEGTRRKPFVLMTTLHGGYIL